MSVLSFVWDGKSSDDFGIEVMRLPDVVSAGLRGSAQIVPGRDGTLYLPEGALEEITLLVECYLPYEQSDDVASLDEIRAWLRGSGWFRQSDVPGRRFRARITDAIYFQPLVVGFRDRVFGITLYAEPYQYMTDVDNIYLTSAGTVTNPATASSRPKLKIEGSGDVTLMVGATRMSFEGLTDGVTVDSELMECLDLDETQLLNSLAHLDEYPVLKPGSNRISWSGSVTKVTVVPRWRYL